FRRPIHHISREVKRAGRGETPGAEKIPRLLNRGGSGTQIIADVTQLREISLARGVPPIIDDIVPKVAARPAGEEGIAASVVGEEVVMPGATLAAKDRGHAMPIVIQALRDD